MSRIIIASAATFETTATITRLAQQGINVTQIATGIGSTESAMIAARLMDLVADRDVFFCCTGGVIGKFEGIKLFSATSVELGAFDIRQKQTALLSDFDPVITLKPLKLNLEPCRVLCSFGVTVGSETNDLSDSCDGTSKTTHLETMELYAVARAWKPVARSLTAIVAATNATGPAAREQWRANFAQAASITADFVGTAVAELIRQKG